MGAYTVTVTAMEVDPTLGAPIPGTENADKLRGTEKNEMIVGMEGDDSLFGFGGDDTLDGGAGNDLLVGGMGADTLMGGAGDGIDTISYNVSPAGVTINLTDGTARGGDADGDTIVDNVAGGRIENVIGSSHDDALTGNRHANKLWGLGGNDELNGDRGNDELYGGSGDDELDGGRNNDTLEGGSGADVLTGSAQMVVGAVGVAQANGALWFGTQANQTDLAPSQVVASQVYKWEVVLRQILADHAAGALGGKSYEINLANGGLVIEYNDGFSLPDDLRAAADNTIAGIISGAVNTMDAMPMAPMEPLRIAIVAPSASNDLAFTQSIVDAVNVIVAEHPGTEVAVTDGTFIVDDAAAAIRGYADEGYDLVIAHGSQYGGSLQEIAGDFPDTAFAWGTSADTFGLSNVSAYTAASDQGGYVMGVIAAGLSDSGVIGVVGPIEVGDAKLYVDGFHNGAVASGDVTVNINYIGSFSDVALASEAAQAHVASGADVLTGSAQMVVGAVGVAQANGALWFGTQANQTDLAPSQVVASIGPDGGRRGGSRPGQRRLLVRYPGQSNHPGPRFGGCLSGVQVGSGAASNHRRHLRRFTGRQGLRDQPRQRRTGFGAQPGIRYTPGDVDAGCHRGSGNYRRQHRYRRQLTQ
jgi:basic membrane protein A